MIDQMETILRIPESIKQDTVNYRGRVENFMQNKTSKAAFRAYRVPMGIYEQRTSGKYMVRIRIPSGMVLPYQLERVAELSKTFSSGLVHVTTRQDLQIHRLNIEDTPDVLEALLKVGLSSRGGGGNTVRNVTACARSGVCPEEVFDVSGYAVAVSEYLLLNQSSFNLPRKFKIDFSGCSEDCAFASVADLGFFAHRANGKEGFAVYAGGGLGPNPRVGVRIEDFIKYEEIFFVSEAVKRLFAKYGDRANKHRARLRYVLKRVGQKEFIKLYKVELQKILDHGLPYTPPEIYDIRSGPIIRSKPVNAGSFSITPSLRDAVMSEKTAGLYTVKLKLSLGDILSEDLARIAQIVKNFGEGILRTTQSQNLLICGVSGKSVNSVLSALKELSIDVIGRPGPNIVTCTGAATCKLGLCLSRSLAEALSKNIAGQVFPSRFDDCVIRISGCPNSCGHHFIADIGFQGRVRRINGSLMPYYDILFGADISEGDAHLAEKIGSLPARSIPALVSDIFLEGSALKKERIKNLIISYKESLLEQIPQEYFYDFGASEPFSLAGRGPGECGAGVMDLIQLDLDEAREALKTAEKAKKSKDRNSNLYKALISGARALLITFGLEPGNDREIFGAFIRQLVEPGWVEPESRDLINAAMDWRMGDRESIDDPARKITDLINRIEKLFQSIDSNLNFRLKPVVNNTGNTENRAGGHIVDLRGVACPLNFVKAKLELEKIDIGEIIDFLLDDGEPVRNVPASFQEQGQDVVGVKKSSGYFRVRVRRKE